jgi:LuxR family maltose regulon positive regulatory protein
MPAGSATARLVTGTKYAPAALGSLARDASGCPPRLPRTVPRERLLDQLSQGAERPLTLLSAPAGYGKTVLATVWAAGETGAPGFVMELDDPDGSPAAFWAAALDGLRRAGVDGPVLGLDVDVALADLPDLTAVARTLAALERPVRWILDCGEVLLPPAVGVGLHALLRGSRGGLRVTLLTRSDPPLPLHRYRLDGAITEIRAGDLAFNREETAQLMEQAGLDLTESDVTALMQRTGGWPAGLRFAEMSLAGQQDVGWAIREFRGDAGNVASYLMSEVLAKQPPGTRQLLLRTCLVDVLEPGLVETLTEGRSGVRELRFMSRGNAFVEPVPGSPFSFRYHPLFREFLRSQLAFEEPGLVPRLHHAAAQWLHVQGQWLPAIRQAVLAEEWSLVGHYLVKDLAFARLFVGPHRATLRSLLADFATASAQTTGAEVALGRSAVALADLDPLRADTELATARARLFDGSPGAAGAAGLALSVLTAIRAGLGADPDVALDRVLSAERALQLAPGEYPTGAPEVAVTIGSAKSRVLLRRGELVAAHDTLEEATRVAETARLTDATHELQGLTALVEAMSGHLRRATDLAVRLGVPEVVPDEAAGQRARLDEAAVAAQAPAATLALAWVRTDECDAASAQWLVGSVETAPHTADTALLTSGAALLRARLAAARGEFALAAAELRAVCADGRPAGEDWWERSLVAAEARCLLAEGRPEEVLALLADEEGSGHVEIDIVLRRARLAAGLPLPDEPGPVTRPVLASAPLGTQVDYRILEATRAVRQGDPARGAEHLDRALRLAGPELLRRPFLEAPDEVATLLAQSGLSADHPWLGLPGTEPETDPAPAPEHAVAHVAAGAGPTAVLPLVSPLTGKEQEVLGLLADLLTTDEIAATLFVSVNTVRSHVRSILRKLGVTRRNQAVRRAWELGLLPPRPAA